MIQPCIYPNFQQNTSLPKINFQPPKFKSADVVSFSGKGIQIQKGTLPRELRHQLTALINNPENNPGCILIGQGAKGKAYRLLTQGMNLVLKIATEKENTGIKAEVDFLETLPPSLQETGQGFVAYGTNNDGYEFMVSKLVEGKANTVPQNKKQLQSLVLGTFFELDKAGILHGDIGEGNILVNPAKDEANLIDYSYGKKFDIFKSTDNRMPPNLILNSNIVLFEMEGIGDYLIRLQNENPKEARAFFKDYLDTKADYHKARVELFKEEFAKRQTELDEQETEKIKSCIAYDEILSKVLKNPSDEVVEMEAQRCQLLHSFQIANKNVFFKRPTEAITNWGRTIMQARQYKDTMQSKSNNCNDKDMKKYLEFQNQYADFYLKTFNNWGRDTINWIFDIFSKPDKSLSGKEQIILANGLQNPLTQAHIEPVYPDTIDLESLILGTKK